METILYKHKVFFETENFSGNTLKAPVFPIDSSELYGFSLKVKSAGGVTFDARVEVSNTPDDDEVWIPLPKTIRKGLSDKDSAIGLDVRTGFSYAQIVLENISGSIDFFQVTSNRSNS